MENPTKKVLLVITKSNWGGAQRYVYDLARGLKDRGMDVRIAYGGTGAPDAPTGALAEKLAEAGIPGIAVKNFMRDISLSREFPALRELIALFKSERPDVVHLNSSKAGGIGALAARIARVPKIVFTSHGLAYDEDRPVLSRLLIWLATWATFLLCHNVIVLTQDAASRARRFPFCAGKISVVQNGIDESTLLRREDARDRLVPNAAQDVPWIGTISELTRNKGVRYLLEAARLLSVRGHVFELCVIGAGEEREAYTELVAGYGLSDRVHLLGFVKDAAKYLQAFDVFTLTSVKEGQPYVLLEAAQAGCAVVASRIPGISDVIDDHTGKLVTPKNPVAIADAIGELLADETLRKTYGTALKLEAARNYSLDRMVEGTLAVYG